MDRIEGIVAFGIDTDPSLDGEQSLYPDRLIVADLTNMPHVPNNSINYMISYNSLTTTNLSKSLPEIYRVLAPGGIADLDIEHWQLSHIHEIQRLDVYRQGRLKVATTDGRFEGSIVDFARLGIELSRTNPNLAKRNYFYGNRFVMRKPFVPIAF